MITSPDLPSSFCKDLYNEDVMDKNNMSALHYVDFYILPHLSSPYFPNVNKQNIINNYSDF
jgi:peptidase E